jgi:hypothetical protein
LLGEIVFPANESNQILKKSQINVLTDDNRLDGLEIEAWPNWEEEFENEFKKPCLDLEVKYQKPKKIKEKPRTLTDILLTIYDCWNLTVQVYLRQNYPNKYALTVGQRNSASSDKPDVSLLDLSDLNSQVLAIEMLTDTESNVSYKSKSNCAKRVRLFTVY